MGLKKMSEIKTNSLRSSLIQNVQQNEEAAKVQDSENEIYFAQKVIDEGKESAGAALDMTFSKVQIEDVGITDALDQLSNDDAALINKDIDNLLYERDENGKITEFKDVSLEQIREFADEELDSFDEQKTGCSVVIDCLMCAKVYHDLAQTAGVKYEGAAAELHNTMMQLSQAADAKSYSAAKNKLNVQIKELRTEFLNHTESDKLKAVLDKVESLTGDKAANIEILDENAVKLSDPQLKTTEEINKMQLGKIKSPEGYAFGFAAVEVKSDSQQKNFEVIQDMASLYARELSLLRSNEATVSSIIEDPEFSQNSDAVEALRQNSEQIKNDLTAKIDAIKDTDDIASFCKVLGDCFTVIQQQGKSVLTDDDFNAVQQALDECLLNNKEKIKAAAEGSETLQAVIDSINDSRDLGAAALLLILGFNVKLIEDAAAVYNPGNKESLFLDYFQALRENAGSGAEFLHKLTQKQVSQKFEEILAGQLKSAVDDYVRSVMSNMLNGRQTMEQLLNNPRLEQNQEAPTIVKHLAAKEIKEKAQANAQSFKQKIDDLHKDTLSSEDYLIRLCTLRKELSTDGEYLLSAADLKDINTLLDSEMQEVFPGKLRDFVNSDPSLADYVQDINADNAPVIFSMLGSVQFDKNIFKIYADKFNPEDKTDFALRFCSVKNQEDADNLACDLAWRFQDSPIKRSSLEQMILGAGEHIEDKKIGNLLYEKFVGLSRLCDFSKLLSDAKIVIPNFNDPRSQIQDFKKIKSEDLIAADKKIIAGTKTNLDSYNRMFFDASFHIFAAEKIKNSGSAELSLKNVESEFHEAHMDDGLSTEQRQTVKDALANITNNVFVSTSQAERATARVNRQSSVIGTTAKQALGALDGGQVQRDVSARIRLEAARFADNLALLTMPLSSSQNRRVLINLAQNNAPYLYTKNGEIAENLTKIHVYEQSLLNRIRSNAGVEEALLSEYNAFMPENLKLTKPSITPSLDEKEEYAARLVQFAASGASKLPDIKELLKDKYVRKNIHDMHVLQDKSQNLLNDIKNAARKNAEGNLNKSNTFKSLLRIAAGECALEDAQNSDKKIEKNGNKNVVQQAFTSKLNAEFSHVHNLSGPCAQRMLGKMTDLGVSRDIAELVLLHYAAHSKKDNYLSVNIDITKSQQHLTNYLAKLNNMSTKDIQRLNDAKQAAQISDNFYNSLTSMQENQTYLVSNKGVLSISADADVAEIEAQIGGSTAFSVTRTKEGYKIAAGQDIFAQLTASGKVTDAVEVSGTLKGEGGNSVEMVFDNARDAALFTTSYIMKNVDADDLSRAGILSTTRHVGIDAELAAEASLTSLVSDDIEGIDATLSASAGGGFNVSKTVSTQGVEIANSGSYRLKAGIELGISNTDEDDNPNALGKIQETTEKVVEAAEKLDVLSPESSEQINNAVALKVSAEKELSVHITSRVVTHPVGGQVTAIEREYTLDSPNLATIGLMCKLHGFSQEVKEQMLSDYRALKEVNEGNAPYSMSLILEPKPSELDELDGKSPEESARLAKELEKHPVKLVWKYQSDLELGSVNIGFGPISFAYSVNRGDISEIHSPIITGQTLKAA